VLRWNSTLPIIIFLLLSAGAGYTQENKAVLKSGPEYIQGIDVLDNNRIAAYFGTYSIADKEAYVYVSEENIPAQEEWEQSLCGGSTYQRIPNKQYQVHFFEMDNGLRIFTITPPEIEWCGFSKTFLTRFQYFYNITREENIITFPAFLNLD